MANRNLSERQNMLLDSERNMEVYKRDDMVQHARFTLSVQEQKTVLYAISKIKPKDTYLNEYTFDIKDFYRLCGIEDQSYTRLKQMLTKLRTKVWWLPLESGEESAVSWFDVIRINKNSGKVTIAFHRDMMPYLLQLAEQDAFYTSYNLRYVLPMSSQYSPRLYELLKSYQKNNREWFFEVEELKRLLDCQNYKRWPDFRRFAIEPAVKEINKYTDINIAYFTQKEGVKVTRIVFMMAEKSKEKLLNVQREIQEALDGQIDMFEAMRSEEQSEESRIRAQFVRENYGNKEK